MCLSSVHDPICSNDSVIIDGSDKCDFLDAMFGILFQAEDQSLISKVFKMEGECFALDRRELGSIRDNIYSRNADN